MGRSTRLSPINVLATDYKNWYVMYNCWERFGGHSISLSVNTRYNGEMRHEDKVAAYMAVWDQLPEYDLEGQVMVSQDDC